MFKDKSNSEAKAHGWGCEVFLSEQLRRTIAGSQCDDDEMNIAVKKEDLAISGATVTNGHFGGMAAVIVVMAICLPGCKKKPDKSVERDQALSRQSAAISATSEAMDSGMVPTSNPFYQQVDVGVGPVAANSARRTTDAVACVDEQIIRVGDLYAYLDSQPIPEYARDVNACVRERLEEVVTSEVLYHEAIRLKIDQQPRVRQRIREMVAQALLKQMVEAPIYQTGITEDEIRQYYETHRYDFSRPEQRRLADIFVAAGSSPSASERERKKELADGLLAKALAGKARTFSDLVDQYSDRPFAYRKGDTGFFDKSGDPIGLDSQLVAAAFSIDRVGQVHSEIVEAQDGFHVLMLVGRRAAVEQPYETVKNQISQKAHHDKVAKAREQYIRNLREKSKVAINADTLAEISERVESRRRESVPAGPLR